jgi:hypothetical protein
VADPPYVNHLATLTVAAAVKQARDDQAAAVRRVEEFHRVTSGRSTWGRARCLPDLVRVCVAAGRLPLAKALLDGFPAGAAMTEPDRRSLLAATAVLAEAHGDPEGAAARYQEAAAGWRAAGHALEQGQALLGLGRCLARLGRAEAGPALREAGALFRGLGCGPLLAEAGAWLRRAEPAGP